MVKPRRVAIMFSVPEGMEASFPSMEASILSGAPNRIQSRLPRKLRDWPRAMIPANRTLPPSERARTSAQQSPRAADSVIVTRAANAGEFRPALRAATCSGAEGDTVAGVFPGGGLFARGAAGSLPWLSW